MSEARTFTPQDTAAGQPHGAPRGRVRFLGDGDADRVLAEACALLERVGLRLEDVEARRLLASLGAWEDASGRVHVPRVMVSDALSAAPGHIALFDVASRPAFEIPGDVVRFVPGSCAVTLLDAGDGTARPPRTADYVRYVRVASALPGLDAQSTAFVPRDVPAAISDAYRLYLSLCHGTKPVVTGAFSGDGWTLMRDLLVAARGGTATLRARPVAVFSCCPTSPLAWTADGARNVIDCARAGVPIELVPAPMAGFVSPVTLFGTLVQHAAEVLGGVVLAQAAAHGAAVVWGGAPSAFDVREQTAPLAAAESVLLAAGSAEVGRRAGLPTQAYLGLSDAKAVDAQGGLESGLGALVAALGAVDYAAGPGLREFGMSFSLEGLVLDHEACLVARRMARGIHAEVDGGLGAAFDELLAEQHVLIADHTLRLRAREMDTAGPLLDRARRGTGGAPGILERARVELDRLVAIAPPPALGEDARRDVRRVMSTAAHAAGLDDLPDGDA